MTSDSEYRRRAFSILASCQSGGQSFSQAWRRIRQAFPWLAGDVDFCISLRAKWDARLRAMLGEPDERPRIWTAGELRTAEPSEYRRGVLDGIRLAIVAKEKRVCGTCRFWDAETGRCETLGRPVSAADCCPLHVDLAAEIASPPVAGQRKPDVSGECSSPQTVKHD